MTYTIAVCTVKTPDDGQRNCPKHVEFYSKNKFEKLVHLVGIIIRISHLTLLNSLKIKLPSAISIDYLVSHFKKIQEKEESCGTVYFYNKNKLKK